MSVSRRVLLLGAPAAAACMPPSWGAGALLHPGRRPLKKRPAGAVETLDFDVGVRLRGWRFRTDRPRRGTLLYLHGLSDNRGASAGIAPRFLARGLDVVAYDSRAHGESGGDACTYGFHERHDLSRVLDQLAVPSVVALGFSMGAAVALQAAAFDPRIAAVVSVATISDLRAAALERAPFFASRRNVEEALRIAEQRGRFKVEDVSPERLAPRIRAPVLLVHGADDDETPAAHSRRVHDALAGPKRLLIIPSAGHADAMTGAVWVEAERWIEAHLG